MAAGEHSDPLSVRRFMTEGAHTIGAHQPISEARRALERHHVRHLPVVDGSGKLAGMVSEPYVRAAEAAGGDRPVSQIMTNRPYVTSPDSSLEWVAAEMLERGVHCAIVVARGRPVGLLTVTDLMRAAAVLLGEVRRESGRKSDKEQPDAHEGVPWDWW